MKQIECTGFIVHYDGDSTVGMFPQYWTLKGNFLFDDEGELNQFKEKICEAFEYCSDTPLWVESLEERSEKINAEIFHLGAHHSL